MIHTFIRKVNYYETDKMQYTHHSNYLRYMEEARSDFMEKMGYGYKRMEENGIASPVVEVSLKYLKPTGFGDELTIKVTPVLFTGVRMSFEYSFICNGEEVCKASSTHCFINAKGAPVSLKRLPDVYELFSSTVENRL